MPPQPRVPGCVTDWPISHDSMQLLTACKVYLVRGRDWGDPPYHDFVPLHHSLVIPQKFPENDRESNNLLLKIPPPIKLLGKTQTGTNIVILSILLDVSFGLVLFSCGCWSGSPVLGQL